MRISLEELTELNKLLSDKTIDIPEFRREVAKTGLNYNWLQKNIKKRNPALNPRILELLAI